MFGRTAAALVVLLVIGIHAEDNDAACSNTIPPESGSYVYSDDETNLNHKYSIYIPTSYDPTVPAKLLLAFHGWGQSDDTWAKTLIHAANERAFVVVVPRGLADADFGSDDASSKPSWSVQGSGSGLDPNGDLICDEQQDVSHCYEHSCDCTNLCQWTHCGDDISFVVNFVTYLNEMICFNDVYATGVSNGGMLVWDLAMMSSIPWSAIAPIVGSPHAGYATVPSNAVPVMTFSGQRDTVIPPGSIDQNNSMDRTVSSANHEAYYYVPISAMLHLWGDGQCDMTMVRVEHTFWPWGYTCRSYCFENDTPLLSDCRSTWGGHSVSYDANLLLDFFNAHAQYRPCDQFATVQRCRAEHPRCEWRSSICTTAVTVQRSHVWLVLLSVIIACAAGLFVLRQRREKSHRVRMDGNELLNEYGDSIK